MIVISITEGVLKNFSVDKKGTYYVYGNHEIVDSIKATHTGVYVSLNVIKASKYDLFELENGTAEFNTEYESVEGRVMGLTVKVVWAPNNAVIKKGNMIIEIPKGHTGFFSALKGWAFDKEDVLTVEGDPEISDISTIGYYRHDIINLADSVSALQVAQKLEITRNLKDSAWNSAQIQQSNITRPLQDSVNISNALVVDIQRNLYSVNNNNDSLVSIKSYLRELGEQLLSLDINQQLKITRPLKDTVHTTIRFSELRQTAYSFHSSSTIYDNLSVMITRNIQEIVPISDNITKKHIQRGVISTVPTSQKLGIETTRLLNDSTNIKSPQLSMGKEVSIYP